MKQHSLRTVAVAMSCVLIQAQALHSEVVLRGGIVRPPITDKIRQSWVDQRVARLRARPGESMFERIGWAQSLAHAMETARLHQRPVFLFTHAGHMNRGRC